MGKRVTGQSSADKTGWEGLRLDGWSWELQARGRWME